MTTIMLRVRWTLSVVIRIFLMIMTLSIISSLLAICIYLYLVEYISSYLFFLDFK